MKAIQRNNITYFPMGIRSADLVLIEGYFQPVRSSAIYKLIKKDFGPRQIVGQNIEDPSDTITLDFKTPVLKLKVY